MRARLDVHRQVRRAGFRKFVNELVWVGDHQVDVEREGRDFANGFDDRRADRQVWDEMSVHHVHVKQIGARLLHGGDLIS